MRLAVCQHGKVGTWAASPGRLSALCAVPGAPRRGRAAALSAAKPRVHRCQAAASLPCREAGCPLAVAWAQRGDSLLLAVSVAGSRRLARGRVSLMYLSVYGTSVYACYSFTRGRFALESSFGFCSDPSPRTLSSRCSGGLAGRHAHVSCALPPILVAKRFCRLTIAASAASSRRAIRAATRVRPRAEPRSRPPSRTASQDVRNAVSSAPRAGADARLSVSAWSCSLPRWRRAVTRRWQLQQGDRATRAVWAGALRGALCLGAAAMWTRGGERRGGVERMSRVGG